MKRLEYTVSGISKNIAAEMEFREEMDENQIAMQLLITGAFLVGIAE